MINLDVSKAAAPYGLYYAPDPASQSVCTIGGNVAFNSGGVHCLKYGMTSNHILGIKVVLADGEVVSLGGDSLEAAGPDLPGFFVGSEGLFGIALEITLRLIARVETYRTVLAAYRSLEAAGNAVAMMVASGLAARRDGDHGPAGDQGDRGGRPRRLPAGRRRPADRRARRRDGAGRGRVRAAARDASASRAPTKSGRHRTTPSGC